MKILMIPVAPFQISDRRMREKLPEKEKEREKVRLAVEGSEGLSECHPASRRRNPVKGQT